MQSIAKAVEVPAPVGEPVEASHPFAFEPREIAQALDRFEKALFDFPCDLGGAPVRVSTRVEGFKVLICGRVWGQIFCEETLILQRYSPHAETYARRAFRAAALNVLRRH